MNRSTLCLMVSACMCAVLVSGCREETSEVKTPVFKSGLPAYTNNSEEFKNVFPREYASYRQNDESMTVTEYKGSVNFRKEDGGNGHGAPVMDKTQPYLKNLWLGYPFSYEYNDARGHTHAIEDILEIDRINRYGAEGKANMPATCWNCKGPFMVQWVGENGDSFWAKDFNEFRDKIDVANESISCSTCHDTTNMELKLYSFPYQDYLARTGQSFEKMSRNEKRAAMCGQCHVEYYFTHPDHGVAQKPVFPWDNGFEFEDFYEYYKDKGPNNGPFVDFVHAVSGVGMLKAQHPDYETWKTGPHGAAGVSCADCHMPYEKADGKKFSSHWWHSPLKDPELTACRKCHADKTAEYLRERVRYTQEKTYRQLLLAQENSVKAHEAVRLANEYAGEKNAKYDSLMAEARENVRKGQFFWDLVSAENSMGFHNPSKMLDALMVSFTCSQKAIDLCIEATDSSIAAGLSGDIHEIVPPIMKHSRKLQQDPEHLKSHKWLSYLPLLPEAEQVWELNKRIK